MPNTYIDQLNDFFIMLLTFNDFKTLFLLVVAIFIVKPLSDQTYNLLPHISNKARAILQLETTDNISDRSILSMIYCLMSILAGFLVNAIHPEFTLHQKVISIIIWPFFSYVLLTVIMLVITNIFAFPFELLRLLIILYYKRSRNK